MKLKVFIILAVSISSGCTTMNESFSCNKTAGDSCLTMDEVNAMTEEKGAYVREKVFKSEIHAEESHKGNEGLWIAEQEHDGVGHV